MPLSKRLQKVLADEFVWYRVQPYHDAFDAQHVAAAAHVSGDVLAKTLVLRDSDGSFLMVALPASCMLDLGAVRKALSRPGLELASESEFAPLFPDCATGAMPPIGGLYGLFLLADLCLLDSDRLLFRGGTHEALVRTRIEDWLSVAHPMIGRWCTHPRGA